MIGSAGMTPGERTRAAQERRATQARVRGGGRFENTAPSRAHVDTDVARIQNREAWYYAPFKPELTLFLIDSRCYVVAGYMYVPSSY